MDSLVFTSNIMWWLRVSIPVYKRCERCDGSRCSVFRCVRSVKDERANVRMNGLYEHAHGTSKEGRG